MPTDRFTKVAQFKTPDQLRRRLTELRIELPVDADLLTASNHSPLAEACRLGPHRVGNRWCIHPMEGWDGNADGTPSELTHRRWRHFGLSGAKLIWGGEAAAVRHDGRANPRQIMATPNHCDSLRALRSSLLEAHRQAGCTTDDLVIGLQLTHSGRFSRPNESGRPAPRVMYHHPWLDARVGITPDADAPLFKDGELERLIDDYLRAAETAHAAGFDFVDVKACHGYLLHESLSAFDRTGRFGGTYENRTRLLLTIIERIRSEVPDLAVGVRLSVFDRPPYVSSDGGGAPIDWKATGASYRWAFGADPTNPLEVDWSEPKRLLRDLDRAGVAAVNVSAGSPYYCPHIQRPAAFPPSDGYPPPEDPLAGAARLLDAARQCKLAAPELLIVATGLTYFQDYLPHVAQAIVRDRWCDSVGLGRMVLSYPELPRDALEQGRLDRKRICRTFSDCTTAPRNGLVSGCYPLDDDYKRRPESKTLHEIKRKLRRGQG